MVGIVKNVVDKFNKISYAMLINSKLDVLFASIRHLLCLTYAQISSQPRELFSPPPAKILSRGGIILSSSINPHFYFIV